MFRALIAGFYFGLQLSVLASLLAGAFAYFIWSQGSAKLVLLCKICSAAGSVLCCRVSFYSNAVAWVIILLCQLNWGGAGNDRYLSRFMIVVLDLLINTSMVCINRFCVPDVWITIRVGYRGELQKAYSVCCVKYSLVDHKSYCSVCRLCDM